MSNLTVPLPPKEQKLFDQMSKQFDNRDYAKAIRTADTILAAVPEHGETLAMKGLTLHTMDKKEEGIALVKAGVAKAMRSGICWHSLGMCYRSDKNFAEAQKTFKIATQRDPKNMNVLRDLSSLSVQLRDWDCFFDSREKLLGLKANVRANWVALSCAYRQLGQTELAAAIMDVMIQIMDAGDNKVEVSEIHLYRAELELMNNQHQKALEILMKHNSEIIDTHIKCKIRAKALASKGDKDKAEAEYMFLIGERFAEGDCIVAIAGLRKIPLGADNLPKGDEASAKMLQLLDQIAVANPKCDYARRVALDCVPLAEFEARLCAYAAPFITKMIPSLLSVLKTLYRCPEKAATIGTVFLRWEAELKANSFVSFGGTPNPALIMWVHAFLASHFTRLCEFEKAHQYVTLAINHTPTVEMLYLLRAKIFHREGKLAEAAEFADKARLLDLQDKYLNGKCAKYQFRAGLIQKGEATMQLFYKPTTVNDTFLVALESQCAWYEREVGDAFFAKGDVVSALQNYLMYEKHHGNSHDELLDFHGYVFRRCNVRAWFDVIARDDSLNSNQFFLLLCPRITRAYIRIFELGEEAIRAKHEPRLKPAPTTDEAEDKRRAQQWDEYYLANVDISEPLSKAQRYVEALLQNRWNTEAAHEVAIEYYLALKKPLLAVQSLIALRKLKSPKVAAFELTIRTSLGTVSLDSRVTVSINDALSSK
ncbi:N-acetyltransferase subunit Nat1, putative [Bodo saltans]|uniref:N-acetyltransferase subunit Nat1, putative n=1 Tax=Bodo saltans TaxID=75058 RepID=A0A0S4IZ29_BODSA|nr:N-acetyltransferase subunit Nat1, putative [Bodo saltans]|eukprot:CUG21331.1 N-acetyltransferase subunit Nat1, putative [Bodo saltans]